MTKYKANTESTKLYRFEGQVDVDGLMHSVKWSGETLAPSKAKAISNLKWRYKKEFDIPNFKKVVLGGRWTCHE